MSVADSAAAGRPGVVVIGPSPGQPDGLATFIGILLTAPSLRRDYELIHLDTTRGKRGAGVASRLNLINLGYFARQVAGFIGLALRRRPRVVHLPVTSYWAFWKDSAFIVLSRLLGMRVVAHLHGGMFDRYYRSRSRPEQILMAAAMRRADVVVALSNYWRTFLLQEVDPRLRVEVVPNTVDPLFAEAVLRREEPRRDGSAVLFVGSLGKRKGVFDILRAIPLVLAEHPNARFLFAGLEDARGEKAEIDRICAEQGLGDAVRFLGRVTGKDKLDLFLGATVFILPSHGENLPYAVIEAMGAGLPLVTTPVGAIPELVEHGRHGLLIEPGDHEALAAGISRLLSDEPLRRAMSAANRERIREGYLPEVAATHFARIYDGLLGGSA